jgi:hypothetical protein
MTHSGDVETLFEHFGGDARSYQEIGRENDAQTAKSRWPLLMKLDLGQPSIAPMKTPADAVAREAGEVNRSAEVAKRHASAQEQTAPPRQSPSFTRPHGHTVASVVPVARDTPPPAEVSAATRFAPLEEVPPAPSPAAYPSRAFNRDGAFAPEPAPRKVMDTSAHAPAPSILGKLFAPAQPQQGDGLENARPAGEPAMLRDIFARLRSDSASNARLPGEPRRR